MKISRVMIGAVIVAAVACAGVAVGVFLFGDDEHVELVITVHGDGTTDPVAGTHSVHMGDDVTIMATPSNGWVLSSVTVNGEQSQFDGDSGSMTLRMDGRKEVVITFLLRDIQIPGSVSHTFDGNEITAYSDSDHYSVTGSIARDAGTYHATFSLRDPDFNRWSDGTVEDKTVEWTILPKQLAASDFDALPDVVYSGVQHTPSLEPVPPLTSDDFTCTYGTNVESGVGTISVEGSANYAGSLTVTFNILKRSLTLNTFVCGGDNEVVYGSEPPYYDHSFEGFVGSDDESVLEGDVILSCSYRAGNDVGRYEIRASTPVAKNYEIVHNHGALVVYRADYDMSSVSFLDTTFVYDGTEKGIAIIGVLPTGLDGKPLFVSYSSGFKDVIEGMEMVATFFTESPNYNVPEPMTAKLTILHKDLVVKVGHISKAYGDEDPALYATLEGLVPGESEDLIRYALICEHGKDVGSYPISVVVDETLQGNYRVVGIDSTFDIVKRQVEFISGNATKAYDGTPLSQDTVSIGGMLLAYDDAVSFSNFASIVEIGSKLNTFDYIFTKGDAANYDIDVINGTLAVVHDSISISVKASSATKVYDGIELFCHDYTYTGNLPASHRLVVTFSDDSKISDVGSVVNRIASVKVMNGDVDVTSFFTIDEPVNGTLTVTERAIIILSDSYTFTYDGTYRKVESFSILGDGFVDGEGVTLTYLRSIRDVGFVVNEFTYVLDDNTLPSNYDIRCQFGMVVVIPLEVNVSVSEDGTKVYGDRDPMFSVKVTDGEGNVITDSGIFWTIQREPGEDVGTYSVSPMGAIQQGNYQVTFMKDSGTLTITRADLTVTADDKYKVYGDADPEFTATIEGLRNGDDGSSLTISFDCAYSDDVGTYGISPTGAIEQGNYRISFVTGSGTFTIGPRPITVSLLEDTFEFNGSEREVALDIVGVIDGDDVRVLSWEGDMTARSVGQYIYRITGWHGADIDNYSVRSHIALSWTITPFVVSDNDIDVVLDRTIIYNGESQCPINGDFTIVIDGIPLSSSDYDVYCDEQVDAGTYHITFILKGNFRGSFFDEWTLSPKKVERPVAEDGLTYDGSEQIGVRPGEGYNVGPGHKGVNAGQYEADVTLLSTNYVWSDGTCDVLSIKWHIGVRDIVDGVFELVPLTYNGELQEPTIGSFRVGDIEVPNGQYLLEFIEHGARDAGEYDLVIKGISNFGGEIVTKWSIDRAKVEAPSSGSSVVYDGNPKTYPFDVEGCDVTGDVEGTDVGDYEAFVMPDANHQWTDGTVGEHGIVWSIVPRTIVDKDISFVDDLTYNGTSQVRTITADIEGVVGDITFDVQGNEQVNAGTYHLVVYGTGNFNGFVVKEWSIAQMGVEKPSPVKDLVYNGKAQAGVPTSDFYICSGTYMAINAGDYGTIVTLISSNYVWSDGTEGAIAIPWSIAKREITEDDVVWKGPLTYNGKLQTPLEYVAIAGFLGEITYVLEGGSQKDAGTYNATLSGNGNFTGIVVKEWRIDTMDIGSAEITLVSSLTYNGGQQTQRIGSVSINGLPVTYNIGKGPSMVDTNIGTDAGIYELIVIGYGNFSGTASKQWEIAPMKVSAPSPIEGLVYSGQVYVGVYSGVGYKVTNNMGVNAMTYNAKAVLVSDNYVWSDGVVDTERVIVWSISPLDISFNQSVFINLSGDLTFNGKEQTQDVSVQFNGTELRPFGPDGGDYTVSNNKGFNADNYSLTVSGLGNFSGSRVIDWKILKYTLSSSDFTGVIDMDYTGGYITQDIQFTGDLYGLVVGEQCTVKYEHNKEPGIASINIVGKGNFDGDVTLYFEIRSTGD